MDHPKESIETLIDVSEATNLYFYELYKKGIMEYRDFWPSGDVAFNIKKVRKKQEKKFRRIVEQFPYEWRAQNQAAYVLRAFSGLQLFPDANHRTGLAISRVHLYAHNLELRGTSADWTALVDAIRSPKSPLNSRCTTDKLRDQNPCLAHIADFYDAHCRRVSVGRTVQSALSRIFGTGPRLDFDDVATFEPEDEKEEAERKALVVQQTKDEPEG